MSRQSNLFSYFTRTPKAEDNNSLCSEEVSSTSSIQKRREKSNNIEAPTSSRPSAGEPSASIRIGDNDELIVEYDSANKRSNESSKPVGRFKRVIISSDEKTDHQLEDTDVDSFKEHENSENVEPPKQKRRRDADEDEFISDEDSKTSVPHCAKSRRFYKTAPRALFGEQKKSNPGEKPRKGVGEIATSLINSFTFIEEKDLISAEKSEQFRQISSAKMPTAKICFSSMINGTNNLTEDDRFPHLDYEFLQPEQIRDSRGRRPSDPGYDVKTLYVSDSFIQKQTPGHRQWWKLKSTHFDTILFFKVGKFYELYHMDAVVAVESLNLNYMRGNFAHCGFPESSYSRFADQLINRGYKVARIEQMETPQQMEVRCRRTQVKDFVVKREICRITSTATRTYGIVEGTDERETDGVTEPDASYLMALAERKLENKKLIEYGVCFVDCSTGQFRLGQFIDNDDENRASLRTLLAHHRPTQFLYEKNGLLAATTAILDTTLGVGVSRHALFPLSEFWSAEQTLMTLRDDTYFGDNLENWPHIFYDSMELLKSDRNDAAVVKPETELSIRALGAVIWYLKECLIDVDLVSMKLFDKYLPNNRINHKPSDAQDQWWQNRSMILDGNSLSNLHVLPLTECFGGGGSRCSNTQRLDGTKFSLMNTINRCATGFGRRAMRVWLCAPSCDVHVLRERQAAVTGLVNEVSFSMSALELLRKVPDLERLFQRIHTLGLKYRAVTHPDGRAQLFEVGRYNRRKVKDLLLALDGMDVIRQLVLLYVFHRKNFSSTELLNRCLVGEEFALMVDDVMHFETSFDRKRALEAGVTVPHRGADAEYDTAVDGVMHAEDRLVDYLEEQKRKLGNSLKYVGTGKNCYGLEVPESISSRVPSDYIFVSKRKGFTRYTNDRLDALKQSLTDARTALATQSAEAMRRVFHEFDVRHKRWAETVVRGVATFDCLLSLARYARESGLKMCLPEFIFGEDVKPFIEIRSGYHPSLVANLSDVVGANNGDKSALNYIPNDCVLGPLPEGNVAEPATNARTMLLTGANMGGKSTLMRQVSSLVILAQIGSMVPAEQMRLTPVDRIFCRIGASDRLIAGQSTFYVELAETNVILREATAHSLVLIDELGRGTSTYDGTAIACAVLRHIALCLGCRAIFSTHYHALCAMIDNNDGARSAAGDANARRELRANVKLAHMACMVENENSEDPTEENITFLYTLAPGAALKSYGFYTAKVAGIGVDIIRRAFTASKLLMEPSA